MNTFKKALLTTSMGLALSLGATQAHAYAFDLGGYAGPVTFKYDVFTAECTTPAGNATDDSPCFGGNDSGGASVGPSGGTLNETTFGVGRVINFEDEFGNTLWAAGDGGEDMMILLYGIADKTITEAPAGVFTIENVGCTGGADCDGKIHMDFYKIDSADFNGFGPGLDQIYSTGRIGFDGWTNVTDLASSEPVFKTEFTSDARGTIPGVDLRQIVDGVTLPASGDGNFLADCVSGDWCTNPDPDNFDTNGQPNGADFAGQFTLRPTTGGPLDAGWLGRAFDPEDTATERNIPEPGILSLFGGALLGLSFFRRFANRRG